MKALDDGGDWVIGAIIGTNLIAIAIDLGTMKSGASLSHTAAIALGSVVIVGAVLGRLLAMACVDKYRAEADHWRKQVELTHAQIDISRRMQAEIDAGNVALKVTATH